LTTVITPFYFVIDTTANKLEGFSQSSLIYDSYPYPERRDYAEKLFSKTNTPTYFSSVNDKVKKFCNIDSRTQP